MIVLEPPPISFCSLTPWVAQRPIRTVGFLSVYWNARIRGVSPVRSASLAFQPCPVYILFGEAFPSLPPTFARFHLSRDKTHALPRPFNLPF